jgi:hypothetical protein
VFASGPQRLLGNGGIKRANERVGGSETGGLVLLKRPRDHVAERGRQIGTQHGERRRLLLLNSALPGERVVGARHNERAAASEHFKKKNANGPQIGAFVTCLVLGKIFGRHVRVRPAAARDRMRAERLGKTEVGQLDRPVLPDQNVGGLHVAVDDALIVREAERAQNSPRDGQRVRERKRAGPFAQHLGQVLAPAPVPSRSGRRRSRGPRPRREW